MSTKIELAEKRFELEEKRWNNFVKRMSAKYGKNWTINTINGTERRMGFGILSRQKKAIGYVVKAKGYK